MYKEAHFYFLDIFMLYFFGNRGYFATFVADKDYIIKKSIP